MTELRPGTTMARIEQLERVTREQRQELLGRLELAEQRIDDLERLRPACMRCLDATATRQTASGPACDECAGVDPFDMPVIAPECARGDCGACRDDVKDGHPCDHECHYPIDHGKPVRWLEPALAPPVPDAEEPW